MTYKQETIKPYNEKEEKGAQVERMFDGIAHSYDLLNHTLSFGIDRLAESSCEMAQAVFARQHSGCCHGNWGFRHLRCQGNQAEADARY